MNIPHTLPDTNEIEVSIFGPGYGECIVIHIGNGKWVIVDSCLDNNRQPSALNYLNLLGIDPSRAVLLVVATHWHDDHIRGMAELVEVCGKADFSCALALGKEEFLAVLEALERRPATATGSGLRELHSVFSLLASRSDHCTYAVSNRLIFNCKGCEIWSLSPSDRALDAFLQQIGQLIPKTFEGKRRIPPLKPNDAAIATLITIEDITILLGADLEKKGWREVLNNYNNPKTKPSVFKVPHHGSKNAHEDRVWTEILSKDPIAAVTPWGLGGSQLPTRNDARRILNFSSRAYITNSRPKVRGTTARYQNNTVNKTIRESGVKIRTVGLSDGMIRFRKQVGSMVDWNVEKFGSACELDVYAK